MPFLRRRGNMASETDMRRLTTAFAPASDDVPELPPPQPEDEAAMPLSRPQSRESGSSLDRPATPPVQQQSNKHRRFSVLRFRLLLSLDVNQPPVPFRPLHPPLCLPPQFQIQIKVLDL